MPSNPNEDDDDTTTGPKRLVAAVKSGWSRFWARVWRGWWTKQ